MIGSEIIFSQPKGKIQPHTGPSILDDNNSAEDSLSNSNMLITKTGVPLDPSNGLAFGFIDGALADQLSDSNQWKDRTNAMDRIEDQFLKLINDERVKTILNETNATNFL